MVRTLESRGDPKQLQLSGRPVRAITDHTMHSVTYRLNALFTFAISVIGVLCFLCAASVYYKTCVPEVDVDLAAIDKLCVVQRLALAIA